MLHYEEPIILSEGKGSWGQGGARAWAQGTVPPWHPSGTTYDAIDTCSFCFQLMCLFTSETWHASVVNNTNPQNFLLLYQVGLK